MTPGQTIMIYVDPETMEMQENWATLINYVADFGTCETWQVEFLNHPGKLYNRLIKKI